MAAAVGRWRTELVRTGGDVNLGLSSPSAEAAGWPCSVKLRLPADPARHSDGGEPQRGLVVGDGRRARPAGRRGGTILTVFCTTTADRITHVAATKWWLDDDL